MDYENMSIMDCMDCLKKLLEEREELLKEYEAFISQSDKIDTPSGEWTIEQKPKQTIMR